MKTFLLAATAAIALIGTSAYATTPLIDDHSTTNAPVAVAGAAANAGAAALSGSVSGAAAINGPNTAINGPNTNTLVGGSNLNTVNGGDNRATVGNVSASTGPSTATSTGGRADSSSTLGNLNTFGGSVIAPVTTTDINTNGQQQGQALIDASKHSASSGSTSGVTGSGNSTSDNRSSATGGTSSANDSSTHSASASGNGAGQTTSITTNYQARRIPVSTAYAAPAVVGGGVCAYTPFSAGLSLLKVSGSASGAVIDKGCERRANADVLARLGFGREATALLMQNDDVARAFADAERARASDPKPLAEAATPEPSTVTVLPVMPSNPVKGTMLPIPNTKIPRG